VLKKSVWVKKKQKGEKKPTRQGNRGGQDEKQTATPECGSKRHNGEKGLPGVGKKKPPEAFFQVAHGRPSVVKKLSTTNAAKLLFKTVVPNGGGDLVVAGLGKAEKRTGIVNFHGKKTATQRYETKYVDNRGVLNPTNIGVRRMDDSVQGENTRILWWAGKEGKKSGNSGL